jgi:hypothetical protein
VNECCLALSLPSTASSSSSKVRRLARTASRLDGRTSFGAATSQVPPVLPARFAVSAIATKQTNGHAGLASDGSETREDRRSSSSTPRYPYSEPLFGSTRPTSRHQKAGDEAYQACQRTLATRWRGRLPYPGMGQPPRGRRPFRRPPDCVVLGAPPRPQPSRSLPVASPAAHRRSKPRQRAGLATGRRPNRRSCRVAEIEAILQQNASLYCRRYGNIGARTVDALEPTLHLSIWNVPALWSGRLLARHINALTDGFALVRARDTAGNGFPSRSDSDTKGNGAALVLPGRERVSNGAAWTGCSTARDEGVRVDLWRISCRARGRPADRRSYQRSTSEKEPG